MATMTLEAGAWVGPRNLYSHCIVDVATSGNVKVACNKRFGPTAIVPENGDENHISRCDKCVKVTDSAPMPVSEIPAIGAAAGKTDSKTDSKTKAEVKAEPKSQTGLTRAQVAKDIKAANKGGKASAETAPTRELRKLVRSAEYGNPLLIGISDTGHYVMDQADKADYLSICGRQLDSGKAGQRDKLCGRCAKLIMHEELVTETARIADEVETERALAVAKEGAEIWSDGVTEPVSAPEPVKAPKPSESVTDAQHKEPVRAAKTNKEEARNKAVSKAIAKGKEAEIPTASQAPTGSGAAPMLDGVATLPRGKMGTAGVRFDSEITDTATVGGRYGWLTSEEYETLISGEGGKSRKRNYWRRVAKNKAHARNIAADRFSGKRGNSGRAH